LRWCHCDAVNSPRCCPQNLFPKRNSRSGIPLSPPSRACHRRATLRLCNVTASSATAGDAKRKMSATWQTWTTAYLPTFKVCGSVRKSRRFQSRGRPHLIANGVKDAALQALKLRRAHKIVVSGSRQIDLHDIFDTAGTICHDGHAI
jgi:hypothetical protein